MPNGQALPLAYPVQGLGKAIEKTGGGPATKVESQVYIFHAVEVEFEETGVAGGGDNVVESVRDVRFRKFYPPALQWASCLSENPVELFVRDRDGGHVYPPFD